jgi:hypothetical protein
MKLRVTRPTALAAAIAMGAIAAAPAMTGPSSAAAKTINKAGPIPCYPFPATCPITLRGPGGPGGIGLPIGGHGPGPAKPPGDGGPGVPYPVFPGLPNPGGPFPGSPYPFLPGFPFGR